MGLLDMLMRGRGAAGLGANLGTVGKMGQMPTPPLDLQNPLPTMAEVNAQRPANLGGANMQAPSMGMPGTKPDWAQGLLAKRQNYTAPVAKNVGGIGGLLGSAGTSFGLEDNGTWQAMMGILAKLGLDGGQGVANAQAAAPPPGPARPSPVSFDPAAYLQSRGITPPQQIKMPF